MNLQSSMDQEFSLWQANGLPSVEYSPAVMEELRVYGEEGFQKIPHGGIEVGAILLGERDGETVRIREWRPMACDHARGPSFVLSPTDGEALRESLVNCSKSPELNGLAVVGWFHTHTRSKIFLSPEDVTIHETYFTEPWHVALVMRPQKDQLPAAGFFVRDAEGKMDCEASAAEFIVRPDPGQTLKPRRNSAAPLGGTAGTGAGRIIGGRPEGITRGLEGMARQERPLFRPIGEPRIPAADGEPVSTAALTAELRPIRQTRVASMPAPLAVEPGFTLPAPPPSAHRFPPKWVAIALVVIAAFVSGVQLWHANLNAQAATLKVEEVDQSLQISWDKSLPVVASADRAVLRIVDGSTVRTVPLSMTAVRNGSVTYMRQADDVELRLTLFHNDQAGIQMFARYVGASAVQGRSLSGAVQGDDEAPPSPERLRLQDDVARLRETLRIEANRAERLREELGLLEASAGIARRR